MHVFRRDHAFGGQIVEIDGMMPEFGAEENDRHLLHPASLHQRQRFKQFVQRAEAARESRDCLGTHEEMHLADGEIVEVEAEFGRHILVWRLFVRQDDVEADRRGADISRATATRFHHARSATCADDKLPMQCLR